MIPIIITNLIKNIFSVAILKEDLRAINDPDLAAIKEDIRFGHLTMNTIDKLMNQFESNPKYDAQTFIDSPQIAFLTAKQKVKTRINYPKNTPPVWPRKIEKPNKHSKYTKTHQKCSNRSPKFASPREY